MSIGESLVSIANDLLSKNQEQALKDLDPKAIELRDQDLAEFKEFDSEIFVFAQKFFQSFYTSIQAADCILEPEKLIEELNKTKARLEDFEKSLKSKEHMKTLVKLKRYHTRLDNLIEAISSDTVKPQDLMAKFDSQILIEREVKGEKLLFLYPPSVKPVLEHSLNLLNYQIAKLIELNTLIQNRISEMHQLSPDLKIYLAGIKEEDLQAFTNGVQKHKETIVSFIEKPDEGEAAEQIGCIATEYAMNILFRVSWDNPTMLHAKTTL